MNFTFIFLYEIKTLGIYIIKQLLLSSLTNFNEKPLFFLNISDYFFIWVGTS